MEDGRLSEGDVLPAILVSAEPRSAETQAWYVTRVIEVLEGAFGPSGLRLCEACMAPRAVVDAHGLVYQTGPVALDEVVRLDDQNRGSAGAARSAIWVDESAEAVSIRIIDLATARVLYAQNVDPNLSENTRTQRAYTMSEELDRRARGDGLTQSFVDISTGHLSLDWTDQWGLGNANLSGVTLSVYDPLLGVGLVHYHCVKPAHAMVGGKAIMSVPTAIVRSFNGSGEVIDPIVTVVAVARVPFGRSNYGAVFTASTNGRVGVGVSLMNVSLLPVLP